MQIPLHWWDGAQSRNQAAGKAAIEGTPRDSVISSVTELGTSQASAKWMMIFQGEWIDEQVMILSCLGMWLVMWLGFPGHTGKGFAPNGEMHCTLQCFMRGQGSLNLSWNIYEYEPFKSRHEDARRRRTTFSVFLGSGVEVIGQTRTNCPQWELGGCHYKHNSVGRHWQDGHQSAGTNFSSPMDSPFF